MSDHIYASEHPETTHVRPGGFTLWFTGLSGSGKTTIAHLVGPELDRRGLVVEYLDGDTVRTHLSKELGFSKEDRDTHIERVGWVTSRLTRQGGGSMKEAPGLPFGRLNLRMQLQPVITVAADVRSAQGRWREWGLPGQYNPDPFKPAVKLADPKGGGSSRPGPAAAPQRDTGGGGPTEWRGGPLPSNGPARSVLRAPAGSSAC